MLHIGKYKTLGLTGILAAFAMVVMAVGASAAFGASEFQAETGSVVGITIEGSGGAAKFETTKSEKIECSTSASTGSIGSATAAKVTVTYKGCKATGSLVSGKCENAGTEEIVTKELTVSPGEKLGTPTTGTRIGLRFAASVLAKFKCATTPLKAEVEVKGNLVCESVGTNVGPSAPFATTGEVVCAESSAGKQTFTEIEIGSTKEVKQELSAVVFGISEKEAQVTTEKLKYSKPVRQT